MHIRNCNLLLLNIFWLQKLSLLIIESYKDAHKKGVQVKISIQEEDWKFICVSGY
ncbi:hypothetical protein GLYMA_17G073150v4 [Glycine max]|nr:hypothetical protein GLYMA_17G073150v4 [Glycine max]KAH1117266.1 hypothetical protein GYH30_046537 [Glycine max]